jgi:hypothetical protein
VSDFRLLCKMLQGSVLSYDWYKTGEGQGLLAHFIDPKTGNGSPSTGNVIKILIL